MRFTVTPWKALMTKQRVRWYYFLAVLQISICNQSWPYVIAQLFEVKLKTPTECIRMDTLEWFSNFNFVRVFESFWKRNKDIF